MPGVYIDFPVYKDYITATFGYDKNFIGDGYRSLPPWGAAGLLLLSCD
ncbi:MAG: hypothetical protein KL787_00085 [Taibaiella sp.]|nr:hypothetical protein [Taibaiella sp.]